MKLSEKRKKSLTAKRTIKIFIESLRSLMMEKPFEKVTVSDICDLAMIPRATFYNYFEDKYDLLDTFCEVFVKRPGIGLPEGDLSEYTMESLASILNLVSEEREFLQKILELNAHGMVFQQLKIAMEREMMNLYNEIDLPYQTIPRELDAQLTSSTIMALCQWWLEHFDEYSSQDVIGYFANMMKALRNS